MTEMRRKDRRVTYEALIDSILKECGVVRIGLYDEDRIYVVPVNYGYTYEDGRLSIYFHGGRSGHRLDCIRRNPKAGFVIDTGEMVIPAEEACDFTNHYHSIIGSGIVTILEDPAEKCRGLEIIMAQTSDRKWAFTERPIRSRCTGWTWKNSRPRPIRPFANDRLYNDRLYINNNKRE